MNTLSISNLTKTYPNGVKALDAVNLELGNGMFGLLGPNGAGKSTLMRTIATLQEPSSGQLAFNDINILKEAYSIRSILGFLPQEFGVYPKISAWRLLDHLAILKGITNKVERHEQVNGLLHQTNLFSHKNKSAHTFSGGMLRRFGIAQALLGNPKLIIVDEPTAGLDPEERNRFLNLLSEIGENVIVILSTHIVEDVQNLCSEMAILNEGKIVLQGIPSDLSARIKGHIWQKRIGKNELKKHQDRYNVISSKLISGQPLIHVYSLENPLNGFEIINPVLEDVYFSQINSKL